MNDQRDKDGSDADEREAAMQISLIELRGRLGNLVRGVLDTESRPWERLGLVEDGDGGVEFQVEESALREDHWVIVYAA